MAPMVCDFEPDPGPSACDLHQDDADEEEWQWIPARLYAIDGGCDHTTLTGELKLLDLYSRSDKTYLSA